MGTQAVGTQLRKWREQRRMSQLDLASDAAISPRHLSFVETGRSTPSREMLLHLAEHLAVPLRERNVLLLAAGYAPTFPERPLDDPQLAQARRAVELVLEAQRPFPAFAIDRHWRIVASNGALGDMYAGVSADLLAPPPNALRLSLHPQGLAPRIENLGEWRAHLLARLRDQLRLTADPELLALQREVQAYPAPEAAVHVSDVLVPLRIRVGELRLSFFSTTMVFGTPAEVTLSELAVESFFPADAATDAAVRSLAAG